MIDLSVSYIYALICPETGAIRYIGQSRYPKKRYGRHISDGAIKLKTHKECWINGLMKKGLSPEMSIIDQVSVDNVDFWEEHYISLYRSWGFDLTNKTYGGMGMRNISNETRNKISKSLTGKKATEETKRRRSETSKITWSSPELRELKRKQTTELIRLGLVCSKKGVPSKRKGVKASAETIAKMSAATTKRFSDPAERERSAINKGSKPFDVYAVVSVKKGNRFRRRNDIELGDIVYSGINISEAARQFDVFAGNIKKCLLGKRDMAGGYIFKYKTQGK